MGPKVPPQRVPSDDCTITEDGVEYQLHAGEAVWVYAGTTVEEVRMLQAFDELQPAVLAAEPDDQADTEGLLAQGQLAIRLLGGALDDALPVFRRRIARWDWTDNDRRPLPQPSEAGAFDLLRLEEVGYLKAVLLGANTAARKNG